MAAASCVRLKECNQMRLLKGFLGFSLHNRRFMAKQGEHGILHKVWDEGRRKNKAPVTSPLFWLLYSLMPTDIDWQQRCQKDQSKHDPLLENCRLSGCQKHRQEHKLQEMTTTRAWNTFKTQYSKNKICLVKVKFRSKHSSGKEKRESLLLKKNSKVMFHIIISLCVVFGLSTLISKS